MSIRKNTVQRNQRGVFAALLGGVLLIALFGIGAFGLDIAHNVSVRTELQSATDAAALGGGHDLLLASTENNADTDALQVAASNTADGVSISNSTPGVTITCQDGAWDNATNSGTITVDATRSIRNMFATIMAHQGDTVHCVSTAQAWRSITGVQANQMFPMAVSLDTTIGHNGVPLYKNNIGDSVTFYINSQQYKNAAWTSFTVKPANAPYINSAIDQALGFSTIQPGFIPSMNVGDTMNLNNGIVGEKKLAGGNYVQQLTDPNQTLVIPVMMGDPPYNQSRPVVGFITVKVQSVQINQAKGEVMSLTTTLVRGLVKGTGGVITKDTGNNGMDAGMQNVSAGTVKLVS